MPKFATPYDTLLRVRRIEEDRAKARLAEANVAARSAAQALEHRRVGYAVAAAGSVAASHAETTVDELRRSTAHATALARAVGHAAAGVEKADAARTVEIEASRVAAMRTQGLERLVERARQAREQELLAADQRTAEESMAGRRGRGPGAGGRPSRRVDEPGAPARGARNEQGEV